MKAYPKYKKIIEMWPEHTGEEIAQAIGTSRQTIYSIANRLRKAGVNLPNKRENAIKRIKEEYEGRSN